MKLFLITGLMVVWAFNSMFLLNFGSSQCHVTGKLKHELEMVFTSASYQEIPSKKGQVIATPNVVTSSKAGRGVAGQAEVHRKSHD